MCIRTRTPCMCVCIHVHLLYMHHMHSALNTIEIGREQKEERKKHHLQCTCTCICLAAIVHAVPPSPRDLTLVRLGTPVMIHTRLMLVSCSPLLLVGGGPWPLVATSLPTLIARVWSVRNVAGLTAAAHMTCKRRHTHLNINNGTIIHLSSPLLVMPLTHSHSYMHMYSYSLVLRPYCVSKQDIQ